MIIDFFGSGIPKRSQKERIAILESVDSDSAATDDYCRFGYDYFDNPDLGIGYGGYSYDGRFKVAATRIAEHYGLKKGDRILEVGCAKGYVLVEFKRLGFDVYGIDTSQYAVSCAHPEVSDKIKVGNAEKLPFPDNFFAFVFAKDMLPHVPENKIRAVIAEFIRVSTGKVFFEIGCGETKEELRRMKAWDPTHQCIHPPQWWDRLFAEYDVECDRHYKILL
ncbi:MAG: class I SAM-dependent methyltransferase [Candidatus Dadabacteria bacterium]|nr:MAG: class I SAM-dependent methyltransferase [Candidatus Dadabacteria bacterium]